jgi:hypothetical protein
VTGKIDKLRRAYRHLTPFERVELLLAAGEADDWSELHALDDTCPTADLPPYVTRLLALQHAACLLAVQLLAREVLLIQQLSAHTAPAAPAGEAASASPPDAALDSLLQEGAALWRAFVAWCQDLDHDPHQVLLLAPLGRDHADPARFLLDLLVERFETWSPDLLRAPDQERRWRHLFRASFRP